jgi:ubiquinone/menaquinone biosynthesis C-methylase UbiE
MMNIIELNKEIEAAAYRIAKKKFENDMDEYVDYMKPIYLTQLFKMALHFEENEILSPANLRENIVALLKERVKGELLEIGCGVGINVLAFGKGVGIDIDEASIKIAKETAEKLSISANFLVGDAVKLAFNKKFDTVLISLLLHDLKEEQQMKILRNTLNYLNKGGKVIIVDHIETISEIERKSGSIGLKQIDEIIIGKRIERNSIKTAAFTEWVKT